MSSQFPAEARLKSPSEFKQVFRSGRKWVGRYFVVFARPNGYEYPRLGLAIGRRVGGAVRRNSLKRLVRESFRIRQEELDGVDLVVVGRTAAGTAPREALFRDLGRCWGKVRHD